MRAAIVVTMGVLWALACRGDEPKKEAQPGRLPPREVAVKKAAGPMTMDGKLDEESWRNAEKLPVDMLHGKGVKVEPAGFGRMTWDATNFYISFEVLDKDVRAEGASRDNGNIVPPNDVIEVFLDVNNDPEHFMELHVNPLNTFNDLFIVRPRAESPLNQRIRYGIMFMPEWGMASYETGAQVQGTLNNSNDVDTGWTCEMLLPFSSLLIPLDLKTPGTGDVWRVHLVVQDGGSSNRYVNWSPDYGGWYHHCFDEWGRVRFAP
ncbi:MAG: carbohydrate-binding family 9-like protein [Planctomycetota bacterium]